MKIFMLDSEQKDILSDKVHEYSHSEFSLDNTVNLWHETMLKTIEKFKNNKKWDIEEL
jgi:hypothetical protein